MDIEGPPSPSNPIDNIFKTLKTLCFLFFILEYLLHFVVISILIIKYGIFCLLPDNFCDVKQNKANHSIWKLVFSKASKFLAKFLAGQSAKFPNIVSEFPL